MKSHNFRTVANLVFGQGSIQELAEQTKRLGGSHIFLVTDKGLVAAGLLVPVLEQINAAGLTCTVFDAVVADPPEQLVLDAAEEARASGADLVVGFGGGSPMDTAKLVAQQAADGAQPLSEIYGVDQITGSRLPLIQIPTTAGTGSEVTPVAIVTTGETTKAGVVSPVLLADCAILDPDLTVGLPAHVTAATGIDSMVHAIEAFTSVHKKNPISDMLAIEAMKLLSDNLVAACKDGKNIIAREAMLRGAMLAGQAFANAPVAAVHALAYPLGGIYHVPHGLSNALVMPHVMRFNISKAAAQYAELAEAIDAPQSGGNSAEARATDLIDYLESLAVEVDAPRRLRDIDIKENAVEELAQAAMLQTRLLVNNPREVTLDDAREIYSAAW